MGIAKTYFLEDNGEVQKAHRFAPSGISLKHSGHFLVVGSTGLFFFVKAVNLFIGRTIKKYITAALIKKEMKTFIKSPIMNLLWLIVK